MKTTIFILTIILFISLISDASPLKLKNDRHHKKHKQKSVSENRSVYFLPKLRNAERVGNVFSRTIAFSGTEFKDSVRRVSGTCVYKVLDNNPRMPAFSVDYNYDGLHQGTSRVRFLENGGKTNNMENQVIDLNTDASGILYNSLIWGTAPLQLKKGTHWSVNIPVPWELGGAGIQSVTVLETDAANHVIKLQREGTSNSNYDHDSSELFLVTKNGQHVRMALTPGLSHWVGITVIKDGLVASDELVTERNIQLTAGDLNFQGTQREYIILNQMPVLP